MKLEYGDKIAVDTATLPAVSNEALIKKGWSHYMGNEQASKVTAWKAKLEAGTPAEGDKPAVAGRTPTADEIEAKKAEFQATALKALQEGTVGVSVARGPAVSPEETVMRQLARAEVTAILKDAGLKVPAGDKVVKFGDGQEFTMAALIARRLEPEADGRAYAHGGRLKAEAAKELKRREREAAKVKGTGLAGL